MLVILSPNTSPFHYIASSAGFLRKWLGPLWLNGSSTVSVRKCWKCLVVFMEQEEEECLAETFMLMCVLGAWGRVWFHRLSFLECWYSRMVFGYNKVINISWFKIRTISPSAQAPKVWMEHIASEDLFQMNVKSFWFLVMGHNPTFPYNFLTSQMIKGK